MIEERYGNLFDMYKQITAEDPYVVPMRIYPAPHYTMGGLWVDYNLMTNVPGLYAIGEANFSDHGANRLGASALMQGLADGYFILPYTIGEYLARTKAGQNSVEDTAFQSVAEECRQRLTRLVEIKGRRSVDSFHREVGKLLWNECGMSRSRAGLQRALREIPAIREEFWENVSVVGTAGDFNQSVEKAGRVADFLEFGELMCVDALHREESCGGHFREEYQTPEGEALRDDDNFCYVGAWGYRGDSAAPELHKEALHFENVALQQRSYK